VFGPYALCIFLFLTLLFIKGAWLNWGTVLAEDGNFEDVSNDVT
jgi:hypothetical protein